MKMPLSYQIIIIIIVIVEITKVFVFSGGEVTRRFSSSSAQPLPGQVMTMVIKMTILMMMMMLDDANDAVGNDDANDAVENDEDTLCDGDDILPSLCPARW